MRAFVALACLIALDTTPIAVAQPRPRSRPPVLVTGRVIDERGAPIAGAIIERSTEEAPERVRILADDQGRFQTLVSPTPAVRFVASHPDFGLQWTDYEWRLWSVYDRIPSEPVVLVLRRGIVLQGTLRDERGHILADEPLFLVPGYIGSGPATVDTTTDSQGHFSFPRAVLNQFDLVPHSMDEWNPTMRDQSGEHLRIRGDTATWLAGASRGQPVDLTAERYMLLLVTVRVTDARGAPLANRTIDLWVRSARPNDYTGSAPRTDSQGRCRALIEQGIAYQLWASDLGNSTARIAPWTTSTPPLWRGTATRPLELTLVLAH